MAEPRQPPEQPMPPELPPDRLQRWFAAEVRAAEQDVKRGLLAGRRPWIRRGRLGSRGLAGGAVAATGVVALLVVALATGFLGGAVVPSPSAGSSAPTASSGIVLGANGIPVSIDGEPVLTPSAALVRAEEATDASTFLAGGWLSDLKGGCAPQEVPSAEPALLDVGLCGEEPALLDSPPIDAQGRGSAADWNGPILWTVFLDGTSPPEPRPSGPPGDPLTLDQAVVLRLHTHDPSAASCAYLRTQCDLAVVVDSVIWRATIGPSPAATASPSGAAYADGIPSTFDGQPVLRPTQAAAQAAASTDASTFLIGGWVGTVYAYTGCATPSGSEGDQVLVRTYCGTYLDESPTGAVEGPLELHFRASVAADWPGLGPVIVRVHTHDPLATTCAAANLDACAHAVVVDALLWNGPTLGPDGLPSWMDGQSTISVPEAQGVLANFDGPAELEVRGWYSGWALPCPTTPASLPPLHGSSLLPDRCQPRVLAPSPVPLGQLGSVASDLNLTLGPGVDAPPVGAVVLEIHGHDPTASACDPSIRAACDTAVIVDRVVWTASTGVVNAAPVPTPTPATSLAEVPSSIDGQPVLRGQAFVDRVSQATDTTPFLVGGWTPVTPEIYFCPMIPAPSPGIMQVLCGGLWFLDAPGDPQGTLQGTPPWVADRIAVVAAVPSWGVPFVMRVHVHVPPVTCQDSDQVACQRSVVEESLVWEGSTPSQ